LRRAEASLRAGKYSPRAAYKYILNRKLKGKAARYVTAEAFGYRGAAENFLMLSEGQRGIAAL